MDNKIRVFKAADDANLLIEQKAIAQSLKNNTVISEDIYVLMLLTPLCPSRKDIYFSQLGKASTDREIYSSKNFSTEILSCKSTILFIHVFPGCDTTTAFNRSKLRFAKICETNKVFQDAASSALMLNQDSKTIYQTGATCIPQLHGATMVNKKLKIWFNLDINFW